MRAAATADHAAAAGDRAAATANHVRLAMETKIVAHKRETDEVSSRLSKLEDMLELRDWVSSLDTALARKVMGSRVFTRLDVVAAASASLTPEQATRYAALTAACGVNVAVRFAALRESAAKVAHRGRSRASAKSHTSDGIDRKRCST